jgi:hypothetical protein
MIQFCPNARVDYMSFADVVYSNASWKASYSHPFLLPSFSKEDIVSEVTVPPIPLQRGRPKIRRLSAFA